MLWCGDLNYRISLPDDDVRELVTRGALSTLFASDELEQTRRGGLAWLGFDESPIAFAPTYKYDQQSDAYDTSAKRRAPAWCDALWISDPSSARRGRSRRRCSRWATWRCSSTSGCRRSRSWVPRGAGRKGEFDYSWLT